jgi:hypothetical protein
LAAKRRFFPSPGQVRSRDRKLGCKEWKQRWYVAEAARRGIPVSQVPFVLYQEVRDIVARQEVESRRLYEQEVSRRRSYGWGN